MTDEIDNGRLHARWKAATAGPSLMNNGERYQGLPRWMAMVSHIL